MKRTTHLCWALAALLVFVAVRPAQAQAFGQKTPLGDYTLTALEDADYRLVFSHLMEDLSVRIAPAPDVPGRQDIRVQSRVFPSVQVHYFALDGMLFLDEAADRSIFATLSDPEDLFTQEAGVPYAEGALPDAVAQRFAQLLPSRLAPVQLKGFDAGHQNGEGLSLLDNGAYVGALQKGQREGQGYYTTLQRDSWYEGEWKAGQRQGRGTQRFADGSSYTGQWDKDKPAALDRYAVVIFPSQDKYSGEAKNGQPEGKGLCKFANGSRYEGQWLQGRPEGQGRFVFADGSTLEGNFVDGQLEGAGRATYVGGTYEGEWRKGRREGEGTETLQDGTVYVGAWFNDLKHGQGSIRYPNGDQYEGNFERDLPNGKGTYTYASGRRYEGDWLMGAKQGQGTLRYDDGRLYQGQWQEGRPHGMGRMDYADGSSYLGEWQLGEWHGQGKLSLPLAAGQSAEQVGQFKNGQPDGPQEIRFSDGGLVQADYAKGSVVGVRVLAESAALSSFLKGQ